MMKRNQYKITHARLIEAFEYDASIGRLRRRNKSRSIAGTAHGKHRRIYIDGEFIYEHILIWFFVHAQWPNGLVDHIDVNGSNNVVDNLRQVTRSENALNRSGPNANNRIGVLGVHAHGNGYRAQLRVGGVAFLGSVRETVEKSRADYMAFRTKYCPQVWAHG